jgi:thiol-disulfide isomerase/thioredoxin
MKFALCLTLAAVTLVPVSAQGPKYFAPDDAVRGRIEEALSKARNSNVRVLAMYGGSWCTSCADFMKATQADPQLLRGYVAVHVHTAEAAVLQPLAQRMRVDLKPEAGPLLAILDQDGSELATMSGARAVDPAKLKPFLERWELAETADSVMGKAVPALGGKLGWVEFRADWCSWCKRLEKFFAASDAAPVLAKYYSVITVDYERNQGAPALAIKLGAKGSVGLPWYAVIDAKAAPLGTSDGPKGNVGFPNDDSERAQFLSLIKSTAKGMSAEELDLVARAIKAAEVPPAAPAKK